MDNFYNTAQRMWRDANILYSDPKSNSWFNTCYLAGYLLECYGKLLIIASSSGNPKSFRHSIEDINSKIQTDIVLNARYSKYCLDLKSTCNTISVGQQKWDPNYRYEDKPTLWSSKSIAESYINQSKVVINMINSMKLDGVI